MGQHYHTRIGRAEAADVGGRKALMHLAMAFPGDDFYASLLGDVLGKELVGDHDDRVAAPFAGDIFHHRNGIGRGAAHVAFRFHFGRGVHISDDRQIGIFLPEQTHIRTGDRCSQGAPCLGVRDQDRLLRRQHLGSLGHKMHARLHDDFGVGLGGFASELQRISDEIGDTMENFRRHVVVSEDNGILLALQRVDGLNVRRMNRPFDLGNNMRRPCDKARASRLRSKRGS